MSKIWDCKRCTWGPFWYCFDVDVTVRRHYHFALLHIPNHNVCCLKSAVVLVLSFIWNYSNRHFCCSKSRVSICLHVLQAKARYVIWVYLNYHFCSLVVLFSPILYVVNVEVVFGESYHPMATSPLRMGRNRSQSQRVPIAWGRKKRSLHASTGSFSVTTSRVFWYGKWNLVTSHLDIIAQRATRSLDLTWNPLGWLSQLKSQLIPPLVKSSSYIPANRKRHPQLFNPLYRWPWWWPWFSWCCQMAGSKRNEFYSINHSPFEYPSSIPVILYISSISQSYSIYHQYPSHIPYTVYIYIYCICNYIYITLYIII